MDRVAAQFPAPAPAPGPMFLAPVVSGYPLLDYEVMPNIPSGTEAVRTNRASKLEMQWAASEAHAATSHANLGISMENAARAELSSTMHELNLAAAATEAQRVAEHTADLQKRSEDAAARAGALAAEVPAAARRGAMRAVHEVVTEAVAEMSREASMVADAARIAEQFAENAAAESAQTAAVPFQAAKLRAGQTMIEYAGQSRELATAVSHLKAKAVEISRQAQQQQKNGDVVTAQRLQMQAHDLMDKAVQMERQAKKFDRTANSINRELSTYDAEANTAASYAAYQANPSGERQALPPLPYPLQIRALAYLPAASPGPAPAPASSPAR